MSYQICRFGSLYIDGEAQSEGKNTQEKPPKKAIITLGNSVLGKAITWVRPEGMDILVAKNTLLMEVSWDNLEKAGYAVDGVDVKIDGRDYLCRLLKVSEAADGDEWAEVLKRTTHLNSFWGWKKAGFWANKLSDSKNGVYYGIANAGIRQSAFRGSICSIIGFRPVLEPKEPIAFGAGSVLSLEGRSFGLRQETVPEANTDAVSFQPVLYPILEGSSIQSIDREMFRDITELRAYTLLMDGKPVRQDMKRGQGYKPGAALELTDRFFGKEYLIQWHVRGYYAEAAQCLLRNVPYQSLVDQGMAVPMKKE